MDLLKRFCNNKYLLNYLDKSLHVCLSSSRLHASASFATRQIDDPSDRQEDQLILKAYKGKIRENVIREDEHQFRIAKSLQKLDDELQTYSPPKPSIWNRFLNKRSTEQRVKGLYLWGSVGCGKTFLMDLFYQNCSLSEKFKRRVHFHRFMLDVHAEIHRIKLGKRALKTGSSNNPIPAVAQLIASESWLLCLDEFQVTDVVDAMILKQLFMHLFDEGVILLATSNRCPDDLYKSGLQRSAFLPFIPILKENCHVMCLDSHIDYRKVPTELRKVYFVTNQLSETVNIDTLFKVLSLAENDIIGPKTFIVNNRQVKLIKTCGRVADCDFYELFAQPLGADDYDMMGKIFHTVILRNIPQMTIKMKSEVRRFITFIDIMYDNRVRVVFSARVPLSELFELSEVEDQDHSNDEHRILLDDLGISAKEGKRLSFVSGEDEVFAVDRTISRITEMQTNQYWESVQPTDTSDHASP